MRVSSSSSFFTQVLVKLITNNLSRLVFSGVGLAEDDVVGLDEDYILESLNTESLIFLMAQL